MPRSPNSLFNSIGDELDRSDLKAGGSNVAVSGELLNDTIRDIVGRRTWTWYVNSTPQTIATISGTSDYPLTTSVLDIAGIILDSGDASTRPLSELPLQDFLDRWPNLAYIGQSRPLDYTMLGPQTIRVAPIPSSSTWNLRVYYTTEFVDIASGAYGSNITQVPERVLEVVKLGLLMRAYRWLGEAQRATIMDDKYEKRIKDEIKMDKDQPDLIIRMRPFRGTQKVPTDQYWKSPFTMGVG